MVAGQTDTDFLHMGINAARADIRTKAGRKLAISKLKSGREVLTIDFSNQLVLLAPADPGKRGVWAFVFDPSLPSSVQNGPAQKMTRGDLKRVAGKPTPGQSEKSLSEASVRPVVVMTPHRRPSSIAFRRPTL